MVKRRPKGEGSIFFSEKEKCWIAQVTLPDGSRKRKRSKRQQVVKDWLLDVRKSIQTGVFVKADQVTVTQYLERYYSDVMLHTLRPKTLAAYEFLIRVHIKPAIGSVKLSQLRPDQIQSLYSLKLNSVNHRFETWTFRSGDFNCFLALNRPKSDGRSRYYSKPVIY